MTRMFQGMPTPPIGCYATVAACHGRPGLDAATVLSPERVVTASLRAVMSATIPVPNQSRESGLCELAVVVKVRAIATGGPACHRASWSGCALRASSRDHANDETLHSPHLRELDYRNVLSRTHQYQCPCEGVAPGSQAAGAKYRQSDPVQHGVAHMAFRRLEPPATLRTASKRKREGVPITSVPTRNGSSRSPAFHAEYSVSLLASAYTTASRSRVNAIGVHLAHSTVIRNKLEGAGTPLCSSNASSPATTSEARGTEVRGSATP